MDLEPYQRINPCGFEGLQVTHLAAHGPADIPQVQEKLVASLAIVLGYGERIHSAGENLPRKQVVGS